MCYHCTYGCPVNADGCGICSKTMLLLYPLMDAVRSGGDLRYLGGDGKYSKTDGLSGWLCDFPPDGRTAGKPEFLSAGFYRTIISQHCIKHA